MRTAASLLPEANLKAPATSKAAERPAVSAARVAEGGPHLSLEARAETRELVTLMDGSASVPVSPKASRAGPEVRTSSLRVPAPGETTKPMMGLDVALTWRRVEVLRSFAPVLLIS